MHSHIRTSSTVRQFGASGARDDSYSDLSPEILGSPQWLENLTKTHRKGYYPASWSSALKPEEPSSLSRQYSTNQYYNEPGSMLSRKSALSSPFPGRPSWSSPSTSLSPKAALSSFSPLPANSNLMHPDVATKIRIQYCPITTGESVPPCTPPQEEIAPALKTHQRQPMKTSADTLLIDTPVLESDTMSTETATCTTTTTTTIPEVPLPYPEHQMMSFLDGGQHILHGNIAEFAEEKSQRSLQVVQAKKELFQQDTLSTSDDSESATISDQTENRTDEIAENEVVEIVDNDMNSWLRDTGTELKDDVLKNEPMSEKEESINGEMARWEEAARRDALRRSKKNDTFVQRADDEGIDLNGLEWIEDDAPPDAENSA